MRYAVATIVVIVLGGSCSSPDENALQIQLDTGTDMGSAGADSGEDVAVQDGTGSDSGGGGDDTGSTWEPPTTTVCASPTPQSPNAVTVAGSVLSLEAVWDGSEVWLAWIERAADASWHGRLQRFDANGMSAGAAVDLGVAAQEQLTKPVALAADGSGAIACFEDMDFGVQCMLGDGAFGAAVADASSPGLAFGAAGYLLAFEAMSSLHVVRLDAEGQFVGMPTTIGPAGTSVDIVATSEGYAVATASTSGTVVRLDRSLTQIGQALSVGMPRSGIRLAAAGSNIGVAWIDTAGDAAAAVVSGGAISAPTTLSSDAQSYGQFDITSGAADFVVSWSEFLGFIGLRALGGDASPLGAAQQAYGVAWDDNAHALVATDSGMLLFATVGSSQDQLDAVALACP